MINFDPIKHEYSRKDNGLILTGVTSCISHIPEELRYSSAFQRKTAIGTFTHNVCERINKTGKANYQGVRPSLKKEVKKYVAGYQLWLANGGWTIEHAELRLYSSKFGYAGTCDIVGIDPFGKRAICDIKTVNTLTAVVALQLAAYLQAYNEMHPKMRASRRYALQLLPDGTYYEQRYKGQRQDIDVFLAKLTSTNWDKANAITF